MAVNPEFINTLCKLANEKLLYNSDITETPKERMKKGNVEIDSLIGWILRNYQSAREPKK